MSNLHLGVHKMMLCSANGCDKTTAGHGLRALQVRVVAATPSKWIDGIVEQASANGWIRIALIDSGETRWVWNHTNLSSEAKPGTPVALHSLYATLVIGSRRINVLVAPTLPELSLA
ncbi:hypothetical protein L1277_001332 [Okibacterium sp. HSC-33S16]|uniref:hypothetical protein n=1 Tax=Okibacterium sp. HSC-33S16 TaxID=2910965 RepID=UPI0020A0F87C|nr:hypothetical protein [Okibacterium sp. HSC-33S16]MCP2031241.1 hypothetical protein [Okibacterium sp. HSC-33S16]